MGTPELDDQIVRFFMRHVVALNVAWDAPDGTREGDACTCFVVEIWDEWFLVTAGHVLKDLYSVIPKRQHVECSLFDAWHEGASRFPVPFSLLDAKYFALDEDGLDLGLVHLDPLYRSALQANGIKAFDERAWRNPPRDMLRHALIGLPDQFIEQHTTSSGSVAVLVSPTLVYLEAVDPPPEMATPFPRFYGKLPDRLYNPHTGASLEEMTGFSGGPILGFKLNSDGQVKYYLVAVQSRWRRKLRVVAGPLMPSIVNWLERQMPSE
jgi:hypothetical protein